MGASIIGIILYGALILYWTVAVVAVTAFFGIALLLGILAWIGYTMATTPPPEPITDLPDTTSAPNPEPGKESG